MKGLQRSLENVYDAGGVGSANGTGVTAKELGIGSVRRTRLTLTDLTVALVDEAGVVGFLSQKIYDFPETAVLFLAAKVDLVITKSSAGIDDDWNGDFALGTVAADNDATLTATEDDLLASTATPVGVSGVSSANGFSATAEAATVYDGTSTAVDLFLNVVVDDGDQDVTGTPANMVFNGTIEFHWINLGDD